MQEVFERVRHLLAPFGWDVTMYDRPHGGVGFRFGLEVRAAGHVLERQRLGVVVEYSGSDLYCARGRPDCLSEVIAFDVMRKAMAEVAKASPAPTHA
jgi:hypothetical protein